MGTQDDRIRVLIDRLERLCSGTASRQEADTVVRAVQALSAAHLRLLERRGRHVRQTGREIEYDLLAADCIAELFQQNTPLHFPKLTAYFAPCFAAGQSPDEIFSALIRLVTRLTQQQVIRFYRQRDPEGARLWRTLIQAARKNPDLVVQREIGGWYLLSQPASATGYYQPDLPTLTRILAPLLPDHPKTGPLLTTLMAGLTAHSGRPVWVALGDIVHIIRSHRQATATARQPLPPPIEEPDQAVYARLIEQSLARIRRGLIAKYIRSGKITLIEGLALHDALVARCRALLEEETPVSDAALILAHWPAGWPPPRQRIHSIFDYLVRTFRRMMQERIKINF